MDRTTPGMISPLMLLTCFALGLLLLTAGCIWNLRRTPLRSDRNVSFGALFSPQPDYPYFKSVQAKALSPGTSEMQRALLCAEAALLSYLPENELVEAHLYRAGFTQVCFFDEAAATGFLALTTEDMLLVFRGTEWHDREDFRADFNLLLTREEEGRVHKGFGEAFDQVVDFLTEHIESASPRRLWITGHSLGGALALVAGQKFNPELVITFGAPRIATTSYREAYPTKVLRFVNNNDVVPLAIPPVLYRHIGELRFFDELGTLQQESTFWERAESRFRGHVHHAREVLDKWKQGDFDAIPNSNFSDHSMLTYAQLTRKQLGDRPQGR